ncbi:glutathione S-transferase N-terminal domain-containing protein [Sphingomonas sp. BN140010]|uniref:Glutathione S-transferase N-terminal domain-containing protein n=1 Tax=Sphingomonas arvum TaxID=2992113 RepID=A0ABT3JGW0_9SPHN|nr:glutathione S-transferase N-terminal domain-containing protein [Sphingomonas sp. BN140010]MCW3798254.1 glutathione S-transferase N-terminal domain-containing protein [Sphingomonas sp. BN140010]
MLTLYYSPGACSLVSHIALEEAGADYRPERIDLAQGEQHGEEFLRVNPHARVPALVTDEGTITENVAILNYVGDTFEADGSVPSDDAFARAQCNQLLGWFASSVHVAFAQMFRPVRTSPDDAIHAGIVEGGRAALTSHFNELDDLCGPGWLVADRFTAADSYAAVFHRWATRAKFDMSVYPRWSSLVGRVIERPAVVRALGQEELKPDDFA